MDSPPPEGTDSEPMDREPILCQVKSYLDALDAWEGDRATEEDTVIVQCLLKAVRAARRKGYDEELLVHVLRNLIQAPPRM